MVIKKLLSQMNTYLALVIYVCINKTWSRSVIQVGVDNPGGAFHFRNSLSKVGAVAGDEESYVTFGSFFNRLVLRKTRL
jgi:hypothetical protein